MPTNIALRRPTYVDNPLYCVPDDSASNLHNLNALQYPPYNEGTINMWS